MNKMVIKIIFISVVFIAGIFILLLKDTEKETINPQFNLPVEEKKQVTTTIVVIPETSTSVLPTSILPEKQVDIVPPIPAVAPEGSKNTAETTVMTTVEAIDEHDKKDEDDFLSYNYEELSKKYGPKPELDKSDNAYSEVATHLKGISNIVPETLKFYGCLEQVFPSERGWLVVCEWNATDKAGKTVQNQNWFTIKDNKVTNMEPGDRYKAEDLLPKLPF